MRERFIFNLGKSGKKTRQRARPAAAPSALTGSIAKLTRNLALSTFAAIGVSQSPAALIYWDNDATAGGNSALTGAGLGGTGAWDTTSSKWWNLASDNAWNNSNLDTAVFWGTAGTVTLGEPITVGGVSFNTTAYSLVATNTLT